MCCNFIYAHNIYNENSNLRLWKIDKQNKIIEGSFSMMKNGKVYIESIDNNISSFLISDFSKVDQDYANHRHDAVVAINSSLKSKKTTAIPISFYLKYIFTAFFY